jgi:fatty acid synthase subunit beta
VDSDFFMTRVADLNVEACRQEKEVPATYGMLMQSSEGADPHIAPLRDELAVSGLTADDIGILSIHGIVPIIAQKSLVGP